MINLLTSDENFDFFAGLSDRIVRHADIFSIVNFACILDIQGRVFQGLRICEIFLVFLLNPPDSGLWVPLGDAEHFQFGPPVQGEPSFGVYTDLWLLTHCYQRRSIHKMAFVCADDTLVVPSIAIFDV